MFDATAPWAPFVFVREPSIAAPHSSNFPMRRALTNPISAVSFKQLPGEFVPKGVVPYCGLRMSAGRRECVLNLALVERCMPELLAGRLVSARLDAGLSRHWRSEDGAGLSLKRLLEYFGDHSVRLGSRAQLDALLDFAKDVYRRPPEQRKTLLAIFSKNAIPCLGRIRDQSRLSSLVGWLLAFEGAAAADTNSSRTEPQYLSLLAPNLQQEAMLWVDVRPFKRRDGKSLLSVLDRIANLKDDQKIVEMLCETMEHFRPDCMALSVARKIASIALARPEKNHSKLVLWQLLKAQSAQLDHHDPKNIPDWPGQIMPLWLSIADRAFVGPERAIALEMLMEMLRSFDSFVPGVQPSLRLISVCLKIDDQHGAQSTLLALLERVVQWSLDDLLIPLGGHARATLYALVMRLITSPAPHRPAVLLNLLRVASKFGDPDGKILLGIVDTSLQVQGKIFRNNTDFSVEASFEELLQSLNEEIQRLAEQERLSAGNDEESETSESDEDF